MVNVVDICMRLRVLTEFLIVDGTNPVEIHRCLRSICGENAVDVSSDVGLVIV